MSTGAIIAIVVVALILLALAMWLGSRSRNRRHEIRRTEAHEIRREAEVRGAEADQMQAEADERAARARREEAAAREQAARAEERHGEAEERHARAHDIDPDTRGDYEPGSGREREGGAAGATESGGVRDERTIADDEPTPRSDVEYEERRFVREGDPEDPDVVREERTRDTGPDR